MADLTLLSNYMRSDDFASADLSQLNFGRVLQAGALGLLGLACSTVPAQISPSEQQRVKNEGMVRDKFGADIGRAKAEGKNEILISQYGHPEPTGINSIDAVLRDYGFLRVKIIGQETVVFEPDALIRTWYKVDVLETLSPQSKLVDEVKLEGVPARFLPLLPSEALLIATGGSVVVDNIRVVRAPDQDEPRFVLGEEYLIAAYMYPASKFIIPVAGVAGVFQIKDDTIKHLGQQQQMAREIEERFGNDLNRFRHNIRLQRQRK